VYTTVAVLVPSGTETLVALVMDGATSVTATVTAWLEVSVPSLATTLNVYELCVSKSGDALNVTAPVALSMLKDPASTPLRLNVTPPPRTSVAAAVYTTVAVLVPSGTVTLVALVIEGATSVTATVTAWAELSVPSLATTLNV
jgi:hypothetical protein